MTTMRQITLQLTVEVPATVGESEVENAINAALDEPPCDWDDWTVSGVSIVGVRMFEAADDDGTSGQDRDGYSDTQDRDSYTVE